MQTVHATPVADKQSAVASVAKNAAVVGGIVVAQTLAFALLHKISEKVGLI